jgi:hypothetical protein
MLKPRFSWLISPVPVCNRSQKTLLVSSEQQ